MITPSVLKASRTLIASNQIPKSPLTLVHDFRKSSYSEAIEQLKDCGHISLEDMQELSSADLNDVFEEIKCWCVYGNHDPKKLRSVLNALNP
jgi:Icc-related predicted phosphoesterase